MAPHMAVIYVLCASASHLKNGDANNSPFLRGLLGELNIHASKALKYLEQSQHFAFVSAMYQCNE